MSNQNIEELESAIAQIEMKIEVDEEFTDKDEFDVLREALTKKMEEIQLFEIDAFPSEKVTETMEEHFYLSRERFEKCKKRIKQIDMDADKDDGADTRMFDRDEEDLID